MRFYVLFALSFFYSTCSFSQQTDSIVNKNLALVNIAGLSRDEIALVIQRIEAKNPKALGIDAWFTHIKSDTLLLPTLYSYNNITIAVKLFYCQNHECDSIRAQYFPYEKEGHVMVNYKTLKFAPGLKYKGRLYPFFCLSLLQDYDSTIVRKFYRRKLYKRSLHFYGNYNSFITIEGREFLNDVYTQEWNLDGKIVILGYLGSQIGKVKDPATETDYKLSSLSNGKLPDMYGIILLANIITDIMIKTSK